MSPGELLMHLAGTEPEQSFCAQERAIDLEGWALGSGPLRRGGGDDAV